MVIWIGIYHLTFHFYIFRRFVFIFHLQSCCYCLLLHSGTRIFFQYWWSCILCYFHPVESCRSTANSLYVSAAWKSIKFRNFFFFFYTIEPLRQKLMCTQENKGWLKPHWIHKHTFSSLISKPVQFGIVCVCARCSPVKQQEPIDQA